jgi:hypothetical protein
VLCNSTRAQAEAEWTGQFLQHLKIGPFEKI